MVPYPGIDRKQTANLRQCQKESAFPGQEDPGTASIERGII